MSAAHEGHEERATEAPSWYSQCEGLLHLFTDHGVDVSNTWGREGSVASCCGFDGSGAFVPGCCKAFKPQSLTRIPDDNARRQVVCDDANGRINAIHWTNEVNGDIRSFDLSALTNLETVDLSGSKGLIGEFPGWMFALKGLKSL